MIELLIGFYIGAGLVNVIVAWMRDDYIGENLKEDILVFVVMIFIWPYIAWFIFRVAILGWGNE
jgi:hypothetical protein